MYVCTCLLICTYIHMYIHICFSSPLHAHEKYASTYVGASGRLHGSKHALHRVRPVQGAGTPGPTAQHTRNSTPVRGHCYSATEGNLHLPCVSMYVCTYVVMYYRLGTYVCTFVYKVQHTAGLCLHENCIKHGLRRTGTQETRNCTYVCM